MEFRIVGPLRSVEVIALGRGIRELRRLRRIHGGRRWRKLKAIATVELADGSLLDAEIHWYEAHGVGRREAKIKRLFDDRDE